MSEMPERDEYRRQTAVIAIRHVRVFVCVCTVASHSSLIAKGRWWAQITDTAGRTADTDLSGWIYEWLGSEGHVDGCVRPAQAIITHPHWRHRCPQTERARRRQARDMIQMPRGSTITLTVLSWRVCMTYRFLKEEAHLMNFFFSKQQSSTWVGWTDYCI